MARPRIDDELRAEIVAALDRGMSQSEIYEQFSDVVSLRTVQGIAAETRKKRERSASTRIQERAESLIANANAGTAESDDRFSDLDNPEKVRAALDAAWKRAAAAERAGDYRSSNAAHKLVADLMILQARMDRIAVADADVVRMSRREIESARESFLARIVDAIKGRGPALCAKCSRELSFDLATRKGAA